MNDELRKRKAKRKLENGIKEEVEKEVIEEQKHEELIDYKTPSRKRSIARIISRIIWIVLFLFILFEVVIGILDMNRLNDDKEPLWYFDSKTEKTKNKTETTYNLGLYVIVKTKEGNTKKIILKPFFLK